MILNFHNWISSQNISVKPDNPHYRLEKGLSGNYYTNDFSKLIQIQYFTVIQVWKWFKLLLEVIKVITWDIITKAVPCVYNHL